MKFKDIPKFTADGNYEVNVTLGYLENTIQNFEEEYFLEVNPDFQRGNVWTEEQQISYIEFFLRGGKTARVIYFNCPYWNNGDCEGYLKGKYEMPMVCVDGLQRLTALRKFLRNELPIFYGYYLNDFEDKDRLLRGNSDIKFNINALQTKKEVLQWYIDFNDGGTVHAKEEIDRVKKMMAELE